MSMSLRDQLLAAGLVSQKQARDAERKQQHQQRQQPKKGRDATPAPTPARQAVPAAKVARDLELNRKQQEKAQRKALQAQIKQLVEQNRLPTVEGGDSYNFVDGSKIRRISVDAGIRARLTRGEIAIVRHGGGYDLVPTAVVERIRERDPNAVVAAGPATETPQVDDAYKEFAVPDDLMW